MLQAASAKQLMLPSFGHANTSLWIIDNWYQQYTMNNMFPWKEITIQLMGFYFVGF